MCPRMWHLWQRLDRCLPLMVEWSDEVVDKVESAGQGMSQRSALRIARGMVGGAQGTEGGVRDFLTASAYVRSGV
jgi:hypothetical protein